MTAASHKHPPPWLFGVVGIPYGVGGSFVGQLMPALADDAQIAIGTIGWFSMLLFVPPMVQFLYAPIVDVGPQRKYWLLLLAGIGALCFSLTFMLPLPDHRTGFLIFGFLGQLITGLTGSCNGGLLAMTIPDDKRGAASAWLNIGNLSGGAVATAVILELRDLGVEDWAVGMVYATMIFLPALAILVVDEPKRERRSAAVVFSDMIHGVRDVLFNKKGLTGIALCLSPVGTAALTNYFTGMKSAFHASPGLVKFTAGPGNAILTALGAWVGGVLCDRYNRRAMYLLSGALTAGCGIAMAIAPHTNITYLWGVLLYLLVTGFCYSAFTATVLETIGQGGAAASMQYALFVAAGNVAINYVGFVDTRFGGSEDDPSVGGVIASDATLNLIGVAVLAFVFWKLGSFGKARLSQAKIELPKAKVVKD